MMVENDFKRNALSTVLYCFCIDTPNAHLRVLNKIKTKIQAKAKTQFISIINDLLAFDEYQEGELLWGNSDLYNFYYDVGSKGLFYTSPMARAKALSILSQLCQCSVRPIFDLLPHIQKMASVPTWEVQGQLIIMSNYVL